MTSIQNPTAAAATLSLPPAVLHLPAGAEHRLPVAAAAPIPDRRGEPAPALQPRVRERDARGSAPPPSQGARGAPVRAAQAPALGFLAQLAGGAQNGPVGALAWHRDGPALSSEAYRRAGAEPPVYSEQPRIFRITV